jgi:septum site-determining protein MinD
MCEVIAIVSGKGGVGKSTLARAAGLALSRSGKKVCLIDLDMGLRSLDILLGLQDRVVFDLADLGEGMCRLKQALVRPRDNENLALISAAQLRGGEAIGQVQLGRVVKGLKPHFDLVLIDCPAGIGRGFLNALHVSDRAVLVSVPGAVELRDAERVRGLVRHLGLADPGLVLNRVRPGDMEDEHFGLKAYREKLEGIRLLGLVPEEIPLGEEGAAGQALETAAFNLAGEERPIQEIRRPGLWKRLALAIRG